MTGLRDYLRAEQRDTSEPASFYVAGAESWEDPRCNMRPRSPFTTDAEVLDEAQLDDPEALDEEDITAAAHMRAAVSYLGED